MKHFIKTLHENRIFSLIIWLVIIFAAIVSLPNLNQVVMEAGNPQMSSKTQMSKAQRLENQWGGGLDGTKSMNVVYHADKGRITNSQQKQIYAKVGKIQKSNGNNGISRITTAHTSPNGASKFISDDQSTEIVNIQVPESNAKSSSFANSIRSQFNVNNGLKTYVTGPQLINQNNNENILNVTNIVTIAAFALALLFIAIAFRSILAPILSFITMMIAYLVSLSATALMATRLALPYSPYIPLLTTLVVILFGTVASFFLYRRFELVLRNSNDEDVDPSKVATRSLVYPFTAVAVITALAFGSLYLLSFSSVRAMGSMVVVVIITLLAVMTITPMFMQLLGPTFFWPKKKTLKLVNEGFWSNLTHISLWQPIVGIVIAAAITVPLVAFYRSNVTYLPNNNLTAKSQAETGSRVLQAHFNQGKPTPVTIYIKNNQPFNNDNTISPIDEVTTKLQSQKNVSRVYSVTQPGGTEINKYYLRDQLSKTASTLKGISNSLSGSQRTLKGANRTLKQKNIKNQTKSVNALIKQLDRINNTSQQAETNNFHTFSPLETAQSSKQAEKSKALRKNLSQLSDQLSNTSQSLNKLSNQISDAQNSGIDAQESVRQYSNQAARVRSEIASVNRTLKESKRKLTPITGYITGVKKSSAGNTFYISPQQINDTDFYQTKYNFASENQKITKLEVEFNDEPTGNTNLNNIHNMQNTVKTQLQNTNLRNVTVAYTGQPIENANVQTNFDRDFMVGTLMILAIVFVGLIIVSRSILHPLWWLITYVMSALAGLQATQLIMHYTTNDGRLNWEAFIAMIVPLGIIGTFELTLLAVSYRKQNPDMLGWLHNGIHSFGKTVSYVMFATIIIMASLFFSLLHSLDFIGLAIIITIIIFNVILPLVMGGLGKLSVTLPLAQLHHLPEHKAKK